jgi:hypothetical protein
MGEERKVQKFWWKSPKERDHSKDRGVNGRMVSDCMIWRLAVGCRLNSVDSGYGCFEHGDESSDSDATDLAT